MIRDVSKASWLAFCHHSDKKSHSEEAVLTVIYNRSKMEKKARIENKVLWFFVSDLVEIGVVGI